MLIRGEEAGSKAGTHPMVAPDYLYGYGDTRLYMRWAALEEAYRRYYSAEAGDKAGGRRGLLERVAEILDTPYTWVVGEGSKAVSWLMGRAEKEKSKGDDVKGILYSIGASAASFATGAAAGLAGLFSPRAWRETIHAVKHPKETLKALRDPLSWSYLAGSIIVPAKVLGLAETRLARVREPDLAVTDKGSLTFNAVKTRSGEIKWTARLEAEGPTRPVGRASLSEPAPERAVEVETPRGRIEVVEARRGRVLRRAFRVEYSSGKRIVGVEEWRFKGLLRPRYEYKGLIVDPMRAEAVALERPKPLGILRDVYALAPPRVVIEPRLWPLGAAAGGFLGLGGLVRGVRSGRAPAASIASEPDARAGTREGRRALGGQVVEAFTLGVAVAPSLQLTGPKGRLGLGPGARVFTLRRRGKRRREVYSEIVYPEAVLPL